MMLKNLNFRNTFFVQCALVFLCTLVARGCGSAGGDPGGCKPVSNNGSYTASTSDLDGKPWTFDIRPSSVDISCAGSSDTGEIVFSGVIKNGQGIPKAGVASAAVLSGEQPSLKRKEKDKIVISDACGSVSYTLTWVCPGQGFSVGGEFLAKSGGLISSSVKIKIENPTPTPTITPTITPAAPAAPARPVATP